MPNDEATPSPSDQPDARVAWQRLLSVSSGVLGEFDRRLDDVHRLGVREFDVLITLDGVGAGKLRMTDLANAVMLSSGGLTRLVGRLEDRGLVRRDPDPTDSRAFHASLTEAGRQRLAKARVTHDGVIEERLAARLPPDEIATLTRILERVLDSDPR
jgi:DNA-binding MarR family transcriptional regulator